MSETPEVKETLPVAKESQAVKEKKPEQKRFVEKGPMVVFDTKTGIYWMKKDSWQDKNKFFNWHESRDFAENKNVRKIGGFSDWRLPTADEALSLYDPGASNVGKGDATLHIDPIFPEGAFKMGWLAGDTSTRRPRFDFAEGKVVSADEYCFGAVRVCRRDLSKSEQEKRRR